MYIYIYHYVSCCSISFYIYIYTYIYSYSHASVIGGWGVVWAKREHSQSHSQTLSCILTLTLTLTLTFTFTLALTLTPTRKLTREIGQVPALEFYGPRQHQVPGIMQEPPRGNNETRDAEQQEEQNAPVQDYPHNLSQLRTHARSHARTKRNDFPVG